MFHGLRFQHPLRELCVSSFFGFACFSIGRWFFASWRRLAFNFCVASIDFCVSAFNFCVASFDFCVSSFVSFAGFSGAC